MIVDGPWNWATYEASRLDVGQAMLPIIEETGERVAPLVTYKGWTVSKQSTEKIAAVELALFLSSSEVQKTFALETYTLPTHAALSNDTELEGDPVLSGFMNQLDVGTPAPTTRAMAMVYGPLVTAFEQVYTGTATADEALSGANTELISIVDGLQRGEAPPSNEGYRTVSVNFTTDGSATYTVTVDGEHHSTLAYDLGNIDSFPPYDSCTADGEEMADVNGVRSLPASAVLVECDLTGMTPNVAHDVVVMGDSGPVYDAAGIEGHALADQQRGLGARIAAVPAHREDARGAVRALPDTEQRAHAELFHLRIVEHDDLDPRTLERLAAAFDEAFGVEDVGGQGDQFLGELDAFGQRALTGPCRFDPVGRADDHRAL